MSMPLKNVIGGLVLLLVGLVYGFLGTQLPERSVPNVPGPAFFPGLVATIIVILSLALLVKGLNGLRREPATESRVAFPLWPALMLIWWLAFVVALPYVGFLLAAIPFFAGLMAMCDQRRWLVIAAGSAIIPTLIFYLFRNGLNILLPLGAWM